MLNDYPFTSHTILYFQHVLHTDIPIIDIINIIKKHNIICYFTIHDFTVFTNNLNIYSSGVYSAYLSNSVIHEDIQTLFTLSTVLYPSMFVKKEIETHYDVPHSILVPHIDEQTNRIHTHTIYPIRNNTIHIMIPTMITEYKGRELYSYLFNHMTMYEWNNIRYRIQYVMFKYNNIEKEPFFISVRGNHHVTILDEYREKELYSIIAKYNVQMLLYLNKWGETFSYALTKGLNSGLPMVYSNIGAFTERIPSMKHYFPIEPQPDTGLIATTDIIPAITRALDYILTQGPTESPREYYLDIPSFYYHTMNRHILDYLDAEYSTHRENYEKILEIVQPYAIYFPQFHEIDENNATFYKGFSDMKNLYLAKQQNDDIQTPLHGLLGYYNLKYNKDIIDTQVLLAKSYGFKGFGIYYYWFATNSITNKHKVFESVIDAFFEKPFEGFDVFFVYANESWSNNPSFNNSANFHRIANDFTEENIDRFISDTLPYFHHPNYRKIDNKPVLFIHHPWEISGAQLDRMYHKLHKACIEHQFSGIHFVVNSMNSYHPAYTNYFHHCAHKSYLASTFMSLHNNRNTLDYDNYIHKFLGSTKEEQQSEIKSCFTNFNNCVRLLKRVNATTLYTYTANSTIERFASFLRHQFQHYTSKRGHHGVSDIHKIMLFNAWNEWGEQMVIEPSNELGFMYLKTIQTELYKLIK